MNRNICIYQEFLTEAHKDRIRETARRTGFTPHFFNLDQFEEAKDCLQHCEVLYAHSADLLRAAPATLKWYCCSFAGVDLYCKDPGLFANPDCLLTNSNVYGVTIAEHVVMVTLMLLRRMPEYIEIVRGHGWSNQLPVRSIRDNEFTILGTGDIGRHVADRLRGREPLLPPPETMMGALCRYISDESVEDFQPMGSNMGILPPLPELIKGKQERYQAMADRAMAAMESYRKAREER